jgi:hypothetical protein
MGEVSVRAVVVVMIACALATSTSGCRKKRGSGGGSSPSPAVATNQTTGATDADADEQLNQKLQGYVRDCLNLFSTRVHVTEGRYAEWVADMKAGPSGSEKDVLGLYEVTGDPARCSVAITKSNAMKPANPVLEKAATDYGAALTAVLPLVDEAYKYYDRGDYKTDKFAKGKELHPKLVTAFEAFNKANEAFTIQLEELQEGLDQRLLAVIEQQDGKRLRWHTKNTLVAAKNVMHEGDDRIDRIDAAKLGTLVDTYAKALDELDAYAKAHKAETEKAFWMDSYIAESQKYVKSARDLLHRIHDKKGFTENEKQWLGRNTGWMVDGSPSQLVARYNDVAKAYNNVHFR